MNRVRKAALQLIRGRANVDSSALELARKIIATQILTPDRKTMDSGDQLLFLLSCDLSAAALPSYSTLDSDHTRQIGAFITSIERYVDDASQKRPLNFLMLAAPGAGKSHFIKCVATSLQSHNVSAITFNMAGLQKHEDLIPPLDAARNLKVEDRIPLLFLDEFDSRPSDISLLLPLLWDGELNLGQRDLKLGKVVIVLAGSDPVLPATIDNARSMGHAISVKEGGNPKLIDLLSRINGGVLTIPSFFDAAKGVDRRADKVCVAVQLLRRRFGNALTVVPYALLNFIARADFRYGVRSIAHLIDLIPHKKNPAELSLNDLRLPLNSPKALKESSLAYHLLHEDQVHGIVTLWKEAAGNTKSVPLYADDTFEHLPRLAQRSSLPDELLFMWTLHRYRNRAHFS